MTRALALDGRNVEGLVGKASVDVFVAASFFAEDRAVRLAAAEATLIEALQLAPDHARAHMFMGAVQIYSNRAAQGISECEWALALNPNLAYAHSFCGAAKYFIGLGEETEAHVNQCLRLSPRDTSAHVWIAFVGYTKIAIAKDAEAVSWLRRAVETDRNYPLAHFALAGALANLGNLAEARAAAQQGFSLAPDTTVSRARAGASSDNPTYLAGRERIFDGMRRAGVPED